jgi:hypothetical protein
MVDDGTCDACLDGWCYRCTQPDGVPVDNVYLLVCCCEERREVSFDPRGSQ